ncbi:unnamed protein product [Rodentolepis nana]|uniref:RNase H type-1 domain-containing protein n=1 Tax=Rodentolepis nana TaxID=102285 RepID=A0A3P7W583_RODNA|nr:unnamed protein product [Rodentolepis nana]
MGLETINVNYPADQWIETINVNYSADQWLVCTVEALENQENVGASVYSELFSFFAVARHNRSAFEGEIEAIRIALCQLSCLDTKFTKAVVLSDSQSAINSIGSREPPKTAEIKECRKLYQMLREKNKTVVLQWIPSHCGINGNELADALVKKWTIILQCMDRPMSFHTYLRENSRPQGSTNSKLENSRPQGVTNLKLEQRETVNSDNLQHSRLAKDQSRC